MKKINFVKSKDKDELGFISSCIDVYRAFNKALITDEVEYLELSKGLNDVFAKASEGKEKLNTKDIDVIEAAILCAHDHGAFTTGMIFGPAREKLKLEILEKIGRSPVEPKRIIRVQPAPEYFELKKLLNAGFKRPVPTYIKPEKVKVENLPHNKPEPIRVEVDDSVGFKPKPLDKEQAEAMEDYNRSMGSSTVVSELAEDIKGRDVDKILDEI
ncbi:hypothetical protein LCGC14_0804830 [marine sediment metagenome]|uniref:Uncharacterized protein n=1 Tax=marine sediment metagenome TaxID=412755 RepID=A0A0F9PNK3_9ZZZZ